MMVRRSLRSSGALLLAALLCVSSARAGGPLGKPGEPITTSQYALDLFVGPVLSSTRVMALGGAFTAVSEGVEGIATNPAAPAVREAWSSDRIDFDWTFGLTSSGSVRGTDFDNDGSVGFSFSDFYFLTGGVSLQAGNWGFGLLLDSQNYHLDRELSATDQRTMQVQLSRAHAQVARRFFDGQLVIGAGLRLGMLGIVADEKNPVDVLNIEGAGFEAGALWAPYELPLRLALTGRTTVGDQPDVAGEVTPDGNGDIQLGGLFLPSKIKMPWELEAGIALQLGRRPLNVRTRYTEALSAEELAADRREREAKGLAVEPRDKQQRARILRERYQQIPRQKLLLTASLLLSGATADAVGVESFLTQVVERSGRELVFTPRVGAEAEPIEGWLKARVGSYLEPSRFDGGSSRAHGTGGFEVKVLPWTVFGLFDDGTWWRLSGAIDVASRYSAWSASLGVWR